MNDDDERIARALQRQEAGLPLSRHDLWCLKAYERRERREPATDVEQLQRTVSDVIEQTLIPELSGLAEDIGADSGTLHKRINKLERELAELRGELRGMRGDRRDDDNVIVPRDVWRRKGAAA
jgi:hypothetical protein